MKELKTEPQNNNSNIEVSTFPVPSYNEKTINIWTENLSKLDKEEIIEKAFKFHAQGNLAKAIKYYQYFIDQGFDDSRVFSNYGILLRGKNKLKEAEILIRRAIKMNPEFTEGYNNLGLILKDMGELSEAEIATRKAIQLKPRFAEAYNNLATILKSNGKVKEAENCLRKSIEIKPDYIEALNNLGTILSQLGKAREAELPIRKAIENKPSSADSHCNLGSILRGIGKLEEAELSIRTAIRIRPNFAEAHYNLGLILKDLGKLNEAKNYFQKSINLEPIQYHRLSKLIDILNSLCMWDELDKYTDYMDQIGIEGKATDPMPFMYLEDNQENQLKRSKKFYEEHKRENLPNMIIQKKSKLNIGYFSSDFRNHAISHLLTRIIELHDKSKFNIYAYSLSEINDFYTERIRTAVFCFRKIKNLGDIEIVNIARNDQLDIAIDLNGYTKDNRMNIFSYRLAPIQINYLGYPSSLGSKCYDYILADKITIPKYNKKFFTEKVIYLPNCHLPHDDTRCQPITKFSREELGLPKNAFVYTCFNKIEKISRKEFNIWIRLLKKVDKSVLWLIKPNQSAIDNILTELTNNNLNKNRVIFAERMKLDDHLSRHYCGDLFLDTFNFNAASTASSALMCGLPIITLLGNSYCSRIAGSILTACNLQELITHDHQEYEYKAYELATNKKMLDNIKEKIQNIKNCSFFNSKNFTLDLERTYINIINNHN